MATSAESSYSRSAEGSYGGSLAGAGWVTFAGTMLILVGFFNVIDGIAAISNSKYLVNQLLFSDLHAWGWFFLIWGILQVCVGFAIYAGAGWAAVVGVIAAFLNAIAQLSWAHTYPVWALTAVAVDVFVMYGLMVYGGRRT